MDLKDVIKLEYKFWLELRRKEHVTRGTILRDTRGRFAKLATRIRRDEPKHSRASKAVSTADESLQRCRWPLEEIAAKDFASDDPGGNFAVKAFACEGAGENGQGAESAYAYAADAWTHSDCWWTPAFAAKLRGVPREILLNAARTGKIKVRAMKHGLEYQARSVTDFVDGH